MTTRRQVFASLVFGLAMLAAGGCGGSPASPGKGGATPTSNKAEAKGNAPAVALDDLELNGAGASFPAPLYQRWFGDFSKQHGCKVEYASVGSGAGIKQFTEGLVDFGASDAAMTPSEIEKVKEGVQLLPMTAGSIVLCYNLKDTDGKAITNLKLSRAAYVGIFLGKITKWNDSEIAKQNADIKLPEKPISVVSRSDSSGTTYVFTKHLSAISEDWKKGPGADKTVKWPTGSGAPKNDGVAGAVKQNEGTIGYVEFGYAEANQIPMAWLENKAGKYPEPNLKTAAAALASVKEFPSDMILWVHDPEGDDSYPIVTYTWIMVRKKFPKTDKLPGLKELVKYCLTDGQKIAGELGYIPLPESVTQSIIAATDNIK